jgi:hydroxymethylglutaryl-CoA lyase
MSELPQRISLREVGPRDGLQNEDPVPTDGKVALINALSRTGVRRIEAVSFVHPDAIPQMADATEVWAQIDRNPDVHYSALVPNLRGAQRGLDAGFREIEVVISASDTHNRRNINRSTDQSLAELPAIVDLVHAYGATLQVIVATAWGCPYEGDVPISRVLYVVERALSAGADTIAYGDTTGMATPTRVTSLVEETRAAHPDLALGLHFHNTRGTGLANVLAALQLGIDDFDASVGGLGGCPYAPGASGNIATEELVHMLEDMGVTTGVDLAALIDVAAQAERLVGHELPSQVLRAGPRTRTAA